MMVSFDKVFKPTIEDEIRSYEKLLELHKEQISQCSTCVYYLSPLSAVLSLDYGSCQLSESIFYDRIFDQSIDCANYEEDTTSTVAWEKILKTLKEKEK